MEHIFKPLFACIVAATLIYSTHSTSAESASSQTPHYHSTKSPIDTQGIYVDVRSIAHYSGSIAQYIPLSCGATASFIAAAAIVYRDYQQPIVSLTSAGICALLGFLCLYHIEQIKQQNPSLN